MKTEITSITYTLNFKQELFLYRDELIAFCGERNLKVPKDSDELTNDSDLNEALYHYTSEVAEIDELSAEITDYDVERLPR